MNVDALKEQIASLGRKEQDEIVAFLFHLRHANDRDYQAEISRRLEDKDSKHWLDPDEFERELDRRNPAK